ncbi:MAG TPA: hypothetical protein VLN73_04050, partial [Alphaproteobacteria bacterium]|nr:hypothetical protein [Alphaproteobacteria bacterium]
MRELGTSDNAQTTIPPGGAPSRLTPGILLHGKEDFEGMRRAGRLAAEMLDFITPHVQPGATTEDL